MTSATLRLIKSSAKTNITCSISNWPDGRFKSYNFTGKLMKVSEVLTEEGNLGLDFSNELVELTCPCTVIIENEKLGKAIYEDCRTIFQNRKSKRDSNPSVDLEIVGDINLTATNILIVKVKVVDVVDHSNNLSKNTLISLLTSLKENSNNKNIPAKTLAPNLAARSSLSSLSSIKNKSQSDNKKEEKEKKENTVLSFFTKTFF